MSTNRERVVVMGGSSGIGEATAKLFVAGGDDVVITGRDPVKLQTARERVGPSGASRVDGTDPEATQRFFSELGPFDHLVLSLSGDKGIGRFAGLSLADLKEGFESKFFAHFLILQSALPMLRGSVTFITAGAARSAIPGTAGLAAINGALHAMVRPLAKELAPVRVNAVSPGVIDTPWWNALPKDFKDQFMANCAAGLPVGRVGTPDDVASAIVMLAKNGFITGTILEIDGGAHMGKC